MLSDSSLRDQNSMGVGDGNSAARDARKIGMAEKQALACNLRIAGATYDQIAKQLGEVHLSLSALEARARSVDATIVAKLLQAEQDAPRLILPS